VGTIETTSAEIPLDRHVVLDGVSWETYQKLVRDLEERHVRLTFDNGNLEIMPPLPLHERWKGRIARLIEALSEERQIEIDGLGSTTFGREDLEKGLEPDECYYVAHAADVRDKQDIDLTIDPPPDLAVEVDITRRSIPRQPIYAALGVPELWRFDGKKLSVLKLDRSGKYAPASKSESFAFLPMDEFGEFVLRMGRDKQLLVLKEFRDWLRSL
jgi:Uma2 family endonuclease